MSRKPPPGIDLEADSVPVVGDNVMKQVAAEAQRQLDLEAEIAALEQALQDRKRELNEIKYHRLPDLMVENQVADITVFVVQNDERLEATIEVADFISASIPSETAISKAQGPERAALIKRRDGALAYLRKNKLEDVIKQSVVIGFSRGEDAKAKKLLDAVKKLRLDDVSSRVNIHPATLSKLARELRQQGKALPDALFNVSEGREATVSINRRKI